MALLLLALLPHGRVPLPLIPDFRNAPGFAPIILTWDGASTVFDLMRAAETEDPACTPVFASHQDGDLVGFDRREKFMLTILPRESEESKDECRQARTWVFLESNLVLYFQLPPESLDATIEIPFFGLGPQRVRAVALTTSGEISAVDVNVVRAAVLTEQLHVDEKLNAAYESECAHGEPVLTLRRIDSVLLKQAFYVLEPNASLPHLQPVHDANVYYGEAERFWRALLDDPARAERKKTVVDVGANVGFYSLWPAADGHRVYAFEPHCVMARALRVSAAVNGASERLSLFEGGVSDEEGFAFVDVKWSEAEGFDTTMISALADMGPAPNVTAAIRRPVTTIDATVRAVDEVFFMKIDVDALEFHVLRGATRLLASPGVRYMRIELNPWGLQRNNMHLEDAAFALITFLWEQGYDVYRYCQEMICSSPASLFGNQFRYNQLDVQSVKKTLYAISFQPEEDIFCVKRPYPFPPGLLLL